MEFHRSSGVFQFQEVSESFVDVVWGPKVFQGYSKDFQRSVPGFSKRFQSRSREFRGDFHGCSIGIQRRSRVFKERSRGFQGTSWGF